MKTSKILSLLMLASIFSMAFAGASQMITETPLLAVGVTAALLLGAKYTYPIIPTPGVFQNGVEVEIWTKWIQENLYESNPHLEFAFNADAFVLQGKIVHIPQAGSKPNVEKNRSTLPATAVKRNDTDILYAMDEYTTDPTHIPDADNVQLSYNKMESVMGEHKEALQEDLGTDILIKWAPTASTNIIRTTGGTVVGHIGTGNRKSFTASDLDKARSLMNKQKISKKDRYAMLDEDMFDQLKAELSVNGNRDYSVVVDPTTGEIKKLSGFTILTRPTVLTYDAAGTAVNPLNATANATDNGAVLCWQKNGVERAAGDVKFFEDENNPTMYGSIYSALVRMGGRKRRNDQAGVVAIVQDAA